MINVANPEEVTLERNLQIVGYLRQKANKKGWMTENSKPISSAILDKVAAILPAFGEVQPYLHCQLDGCVTLMYGHENGNTLDIIVKDQPEAIVVTRTDSKLHPGRKVIRRVIKKPEELPAMVTDFYS